MLAARLGPLGHGPGFEGFSAAGRNRSRFLLMKNGGSIHPSGHVILRLSISSVSTNQNQATPKRPNGLRVLGHFTRWEEKKFGLRRRGCAQAHSYPPGLENMFALKWALGLMKEDSGPLGSRASKGPLVALLPSTSRQNQAQQTLAGFH